MTGTQIHGYTTAFWWNIALFAAGSVPAALLLRHGVAGFASQDPILPTAHHLGAASPSRSSRTLSRRIRVLDCRTHRS
jgi:hypothetical protein